jgi:multiple sugar transport system permease protein
MMVPRVHSSRNFPGSNPVRWSRIRPGWWGSLCIGPAVGLLFLFAAVPILDALWLSFHRRLPIFNINEFVGLENYLLLARDDRFWKACWTTVYFTVCSVAAEITLGMAIALLMDGLWRHQRSGGAWKRVIMLIPWAIPTVVSARMWEWLFHPEYGLFNYLLLACGLIREPITWLGSPAWALHAAIFMDVWKTTPFAALLLLGGLQAIPQELYLAARVDGASRWTIFCRVTFPLLSPVVLIVLAFRTMDAFRVFDAVYVLTGGGPGNSTETLSIYAYKMLFQTLQFGYGSAVTSAMFGLVLCMTVGYLLLLRRGLQKSS